MLKSKLGNTYIIGEIGINHNGSLAKACDLITMAHECGCDAVKFQKRSVVDVVPKDKWDIRKQTPWGELRYIDYKLRLELTIDEYTYIDEHCKGLGIDWFASSWDVQSLQEMDRYNPKCHKIASAMLTDDDFVKAVKKTRRHVLMSTGMSTVDEIRHAMNLLTHAPPASVTLLHCVSCYPCENEHVHLLGMQALRSAFLCPVGYSGHERGCQITLAAVALGARVVERHITLDRTDFGSDQAASLEPPRLRKLCEDIRVIEKAMGEEVIQLQDCELASRNALRPGQYV